MNRDTQHDGTLPSSNAECIYALCRLCWVSQISPLSWVSLCWMSWSSYAQCRSLSIARRHVLVNATQRFKSLADLKWKLLIFRRFLFSKVWNGRRLSRNGGVGSCQSLWVIFPVNASVGLVRKNGSQCCQRRQNNFGWAGKLRIKPVWHWWLFCHFYNLQILPLDSGVYEFWCHDTQHNATQHRKCLIL